MRNCPHCNKEIKDEAVFCRFCRRDVELPSWMASLQKCPFCAEWIERDLENCPLCGKMLRAPEPGEVVQTKESTPDSFIANLRKHAERLDVRTSKEPIEELPLEEEPSPLPVEQPKRVSPFTSSRPQTEGLAGLRSRRLDKAAEINAYSDLLPEEDYTETKEEREPRIRVMPSLGRGLLSIVLVAIIGIVVIAFVTGPGKGLLQQKTPTTVPQTPNILPAETPFVAATLPPQPSEMGTPSEIPLTPMEEACLRWNKVTVEDEGRELCVYGVVRRWFAVEDIPFVAIFTEDLGTFAFVDHTAKHSEIKPGMCIMGTGEIEVMRGVRPYIDIELQSIELCPEELEYTP
jgi:hypothetical protein